MAPARRASEPVAGDEAVEADGTVPPAWAAALIQQLQAQVAEQAATQSAQMQAQLDGALASLAQAQEGGTATATATVLQAAEAEAAPAAVAAAATEAELREWLAAEGGLGPLPTGLLLAI
jgi:hypothetical protein